MKSHQFESFKQHILMKIKEAPTHKEPFSYMYIEKIFPDILYDYIRRYSLHVLNNGVFQKRPQDSALFSNKRFNLATDPNMLIFQQLFSDISIKNAFLNKFYVENNLASVSPVSIHTQEFEFVYTSKDSFQNIHVDIPAKFLSLVFYLPHFSVDEKNASINATCLYDKELNPIHGAKYFENSVCIFAPHFFSYHGFSTTIERTSLVLFYIDKQRLLKDDQEIKISPSDSEIEKFKNHIFDKLSRHSLLEYNSKKLDLFIEKKQCKINAPQGRVLL